MPPTDLLASTLPPQHLPALERINVEVVDDQQIRPPAKKIQNDDDLASWRTSKAHHDVSLFVARLAEAAVGKPTEWPLHGKSELQCPFVVAVLDTLQEIDGWTREIEPRKTPQRFGNLAFRDWGERLEERLDSIHERLLDPWPELKMFIPELRAYLADSFGSFVRIDYGSGHEVNFIAWLAYLYRLGLFEQIPQAAEGNSQPAVFQPTRVEQQLASQVIPLYLQVVWNLQDRYALEPAGSHGVWGLDDYQFIPYVVGAAQLRMQDEYKPQYYSKPSHKPARRLNPTELLGFVPSTDGPPFPNLFTSSIARIHSLKTGPFFEHSPLLSDISATVPNWKKVHSGMLKMWDNEVLGKRPVVQHFVFGGIGYRWQGTEPSGSSTSKTESQSPASGLTSSVTRPTAATQAPTGAPWARSNAGKGPLAETSSLGSALGVRPSSTSRSQQRLPTAGPGTTAPWSQRK